MRKSSTTTPRDAPDVVGRRIALAFLLTLPLAACGRKGAPEPPEDADPKAPRRFPTR